MALQVIAFMGETCTISHKMYPVLQNLQRRIQQAGLPIAIKIVNATQQPQTNYKFGVTGTPTFFIADDGKSPAGGAPLIYARMSSIIPEEEFWQVLKALSWDGRGRPLPT